MDAIVDFKVIAKSKKVNYKIVFNPFEDQSKDFFLKW